MKFESVMTAHIAGGSGVIAAMNFIAVYACLTGFQA